MKIDNRIKFEEKYINDDYGNTTFYFIADTSLLRELVGNKYPEADGMTISIEFPADNVEARYGSVCISPYKESGDGCFGQVEDYDWTDIDLPYEEIEEFIRMATR